ncbi:proline dehydrogenase family protein [Desulfurivibrio sp. C05AmB]|uniref:proline dehydrogenase family protein n=1 Tax=Desulfurivibrio sp. C05AmB TaxID=3374371 RepID=UPI00376EC5FA
MDFDQLAAAIRQRTSDLQEQIAGRKSVIFDRRHWTGRVLTAAMEDDAFRVRLFRFIDVLPSLPNEAAIAAQLEEYFAWPGTELPAVFYEDLEGESAEILTGKTLAPLIKKRIEQLAAQFIVGRDLAQALPVLDDLRERGLTFSLDLLGEATLSENEAHAFRSSYLELLNALHAQQTHWRTLGPDKGTELDWGCAPKINISVKPSSLYSQISPVDFNGSVAKVADRLRPIYARAREIGAFVCIDMEQRQYKNISIAVYKQLKREAAFRGYPHLGLVLQSYLPETATDLDDLLHFATSENIPISVRLAKGAYWDYEIVNAALHNRPPPVFTAKEETDAAFERLAATILRHHRHCHLACATHNIRSIAAVLETARHLGVPEERYEFQVLYGMGEPIREALLTTTGRVRLYGPCGELLPGMAYLVRRLLENTASTSFLRASFAETNRDQTAAGTKRPAAPPGNSKPVSAEKRQEDRGFGNEPALDFTLAATRRLFAAAVAAGEKRTPAAHPLYIGGREYPGAGLLASTDPAEPERIIGLVGQASPSDLTRALDTARAAYPAWRDLDYRRRTAFLQAAAVIMRRERYDLAALQVLECGKQWSEAAGDVDEAIDFFEYYAWQMQRWGAGQSLPSPAGEENIARWQGRGVAAVIAPWNFPMAISCGMTAAALAAGNTVLYKPSNRSPVCGARLAAIFRQTGLPDGVFNFVPFSGAAGGDFLISHPDLDLIAFTGSLEVGAAINRQAAALSPGQRQIKKVITEMGGKNAIIVDADADLDAAVSAVVAAAFGYQGQKCSACSRVIVLAPVYAKFVSRLIDATASLKIGPAARPENTLGPVIDGEARDQIRAAIEAGKKEATLLFAAELPPDLAAGNYVAPVIFGDVAPHHRLAREEIFGPVLGVFRATSFTEALALANDSPYALTGGVFSRRPSHLELATQRFLVGNLYLNRTITGAKVGRQPFGGFKLSGIGFQAGGPDYLLQFMTASTISENTLRRGFAPLDQATGAKIRL